MILIRCDKNMVKVLENLKKYEVGLRLFAMDEMFYRENLMYDESLVSREFNSINLIFADEGFITPRSFRDVTDTVLEEDGIDFFPAVIDGFKIKANDIKLIDNENMHFNFVMVVARDINTGRFLPLTIIECEGGPEIFPRKSDKSLSIVISIEEWKYRISRNISTEPAIQQ